MIYGVYSIYDKLSGEYTDLRLFKNEELARRYFKGICKGCKFADELQLFKMCEYDIEKGINFYNFNIENGFVLPVFVCGGVLDE